MKADCWVRNKQPEKEANIVAEEEKVSNYIVYLVISYNN